MNSITIFGVGKDCAHTTVRNTEVCKFKDALTKESSKRYVSRLREQLPMYGFKQEDCPFFDCIPKVCFASKYIRKGNGTREWNAYNGIVTLTTSQNANLADCELIKRRAAMLPQTLMAFNTLNQRSVIILVRVALPDESLPKDETDAALFHQQAYRIAVTAYSSMLPTQIEITPPTLDECFPMSLDESPYYNEKAVPFLLMQPTASAIMNQEKEEICHSMKPMSNDAIDYLRMFEVCYHKALEEIPEWTYDDAPEKMITAITECCHDFNLPAEEVATSIGFRFRSVDSDVIRSIVNNVYESKRKRSDYSSLPKKQITALRLREFLCRRYDIRYNEITKATEYRNRFSLQVRYRSLTKRDINSMKHEAALEGIEAFDSEVNGLLHSNFIPTYNPIDDYFSKLPEWDGKDRIKDLARMVPTSNKNWRRLFGRWFLSMVAHWLSIDTKHANSTVPILIGEQGYRKSSFCRILLPPELRDYYTDSIDMRNDIEAERHLGRFLLINVDEFDQLSHNEFGFLKHLFQKPVTNLRRSYSQEYVTERRYASFMATSNCQEILRDPTGNRRYMCVEVTDMINVEKPIFYDQLYAQALSMIRNGERAWLNDEDERLIRLGNEGFDVKSPLEQLLLNYFSISTENVSSYSSLRPMEIMNVLRTCEGFTRKMDNVAELGRILRKHCAYNVRQSNGVYYRVRQINK